MVVITVAATILIMACSKVPSGVLPKEKMAQMLADFHTGEAVVDMNRGEFYNDSLRQLYKQSVYAHHGITAEEADSSFAWYGAHMEEYMAVYDRVIEILEHRSIETGNRIAAEAALSIAGDSVDVWPSARHLVFNALMPTDITTFSFESDENWKKGDNYTWRAKFFNNPEELNWAIAALYNDGSVESVQRAFAGDGWFELSLQTDSTKHVKRLYGYMAAKYRPGASLKADSVEMIRKHSTPDNYGNRYNVIQHGMLNAPDTKTDSISPR